MTFTVPPTVPKMIRKSKVTTQVLGFAWAMAALAFCFSRVWS